MNADPYKAREGRRAKSKPGDIEDLQAKLWAAIERADEVLQDAQTHELALKACHCLGQLCGQYAKLLETGEYESRLRHLEKRLGELLI